MTPQTWTLSTRDFRVLWQEFDATEYPVEFAYTGVDDLERKGDAPQLSGLRLVDLSTQQRAAMTALCRPAITIAVTGIDGSKPFDDPRHHVRLVSATDDKQYVYLASQQLGSTVGVGGSVSITRHTFASWTRNLVAMLPPTGAGSLPADTAVEFESIPGIDFEQVGIVVRSRAVTAARAFIHPGPGACGSIRLEIGSITDGHRRTVMKARYRDIPDDGRYLLITDNPGAALPVDPLTFAKTLNRIVNTIRARHTTATGMQI